MSFAAITMVGPYGLNVTIARPVPSPLTVDYQQLLPVSVGCFGIDNAGGGYFDAAGATPGEQAALGFDVNANRPTLTRCSSPTTAGVDEDQAARFGAESRQHRPSGPSAPPAGATPTSGSTGGVVSFHSVPLPDGTRGYFGRRPDDCLMACVATVLQAPDAPDLQIDARLRAGTAPQEGDLVTGRQLHEWLAGRGVRMRVHERVPVDIDRCIGVVPIEGWFKSHCLVLSRGGELLHDPAGRGVGIV